MKKFFSYAKEKAKLIAKDSKVTTNEREEGVDYKMLCEELEDKIIQLENQLKKYEAQSPIAEYLSYRSTTTNTVLWGNFDEPPVRVSNSIYIPRR